MCGNSKVAFYTVLLDAVDCKIFLHPVRVRHVEKVLRLFPTQQQITFNAIACPNVMCVFQSDSRLQR